MDSNEKYLSLITSEYANKELFNKYVESFLSYLSPSVDNLNLFNEIFDLDVAVGDQLDIIGTLVGISRNLPIVDEDIPSTLDDTTYRKVIKSKIYMNNWNGTREGLDNIIKVIFPGLTYEIVDNQDMSYKVTIMDPDITAQERALLFNGFILPKPVGISVNYEILEAQYFGWDYETAFVAGWDTGMWSNS